MSQQTNLNIFSGSMNMDTNPSFIKEGDYVMARNMRVGFSEEDNMGCAENIRSSLKIDNPLVQDNGRYITIGCAPYEAGSKAYYFVRDTQGSDHGIYEFNLLTRSVSLVMKFPYGLGNRIASCKYFNDMLFWTDEVSDPKLIFVSLAKSGYKYPKYETVTLIKPPPDREITFEVVKGTKTTYPLGPNQYQFSYRYVFVGNQRSTWSSTSRTCVVMDGSYEKIVLTMPGTMVLQPELYQGFIKYIEIQFRSDELQAWRFMKRIPFPTTATSAFTTDFFNDGEYPAVATIETDTPFSDIPLKCNTLDYAENRIALAGNTYGRDEVSNISSTNISTETFAPVDGGLYWLQNGLYYAGVELLDPFDRKSGVYPLGSFRSSARSGDFLATRVTIPVQGILPDWVENWRLVISKCANKSSFLQVHIAVVSATSDSLVFSGTFVSPTPYEYAWVFTKGDKVSIITSDVNGSSAPSGAQDLPVTFDETTNQYTVRGNFTGITNGATVEFSTPVSNADTRFYYGAGQTFPVALNSSGQKTFGTDLPNGKNVVLDGGDTFYRISSNAQSLSPFDKAIIDSVAAVAAVNERIRVLKQPLVYYSPSTEPDAVVELIRAIESGVTTASTASNNLAFGGYSVESASYATLSNSYSDLLVAANSWYDAGGGNLVVLLSRFNEFLASYNLAMAQFQTTNTIGNGVATSIQGTDRTQRPNMGLDQYENWFHSIGRPNVIPSGIQSQIYEQSTVAVTDPYIQGTNINGLNMVSVSAANLSKKTYPTELGEIIRIGVVRDYQINGSVLLCVTQYNCYAIYLGKVQYTNTDGTSQIATSDQILGSYNLLAGGFGTIDPESVHFFGTTARGWDALKGVIWRYSQDGLTPLSMEYGANSYSNKIANRSSDTRDSPLQTAVAAYDPFFDEYLLCIKDIESDANETIAFNESKNGFSAFYSMSPDWMATLNRFAMAWRSGQLYLLRGADDYNNLLGVDVQSSFAFVSKAQNPFDTLNVQSVRAYAQDNWSVAVKGIKRTRTSRQEANMGLTWSQEREDYFDYPVAPSADGTPMKSRHFIIELKLDPTVKELSVLYGAQTIDSVSPKSPTKS
jgi:hypothetical protein